MGDRVPVTPGAETDVFAADIGADPGTQFGEKIGLRAAVAQDAVDPEPGDMVEAEPGDAAGRKVAENAALYSVAGGMDVDGLDDGQPAVTVISASKDRILSGPAVCAAAGMAPMARTAPAIRTMAA